MLALIFCLSLCACGGGNDGGNGDSGTGGSDGTGGAGDPSASVCDGGITPDASWELMKYLYGDWQRVVTSPICDIDTVSIYQDGTCKVKNETFTLGGVTEVKDPATAIYELIPTHRERTIFSHSIHYTKDSGSISDWYTNFAVIRSIGSIRLLPD